jgi:imidazolonepropionase-like amidohydrolase
MTLALVRNGVAITAGTDAGNPGIVPGFSLHDELECLSKIGLSNEVVLNSATAAAAKWIGSNAGKIEVGRQADLVLLDGNPLEDIRNTRKINAVVVKGKYTDRDQLDEMLLSIKEANNRSRKISIEKYLEE